ncbi:MAG: NAD(P)H-dependent oxidoreductase subunit E [bacterium]|nr:NAD(P)H-dependent oxidoreductase subunit E [bacterium]
MKKIEVRVCLGTTCFVMGSSNLQNLTELIPQKFGDKVEVVGSPCLGVCSTNWEYSKAPYVKVNDTIVQEATVDKVIAEIERQLGKNE